MVRERVALVEDDTDLSSTLRLALEKEGFDVVQFPTGRAGLDGILESPPDLVLLDLFMPDGQGVEVVRGRTASCRAVVEGQMHDLLRLVTGGRIRTRYAGTADPTSSPSRSPW